MIPRTRILRALRAFLPLSLGLGITLLFSASLAPQRRLPSQASRATMAASLQGGTLPRRASAFPSSVLAGFTAGLYRISPDGSQVQALWTGGEVRNIHPAPSGGGFFLADSGIYRYEDSGEVQQRNTGLPTRSYKYLRNGLKTLEKRTVELKALAFDPAAAGKLAAASGEEVFLSSDDGRRWQSLGFPAGSAGARALAFSPAPDGSPALWLAHPVRGLFYRRLATEPQSGSAGAGSGTTRADTGWKAFNEGLPSVWGAIREEVSGLIPTGSGLYAATTFAGRLFLLAPGASRFVPVYDASNYEHIIESPTLAQDGSLRYLGTDGPRLLRRLTVRGPASTAAPPTGAPAGAATAATKASPPGTGTNPPQQARPATGSEAPSALPTSPDSTVSIPDAEAAAIAAGVASLLPEAGLQSLAWRQSGRPQSIGELWMLFPPRPKPHRADASRREGLYLQTTYLATPAARTAKFDMLASKGLSTLVLDIKDDKGKLHFTTRNPSLARVGLTEEALNPEVLAREAHARGIHLVARIVVFKDEAFWRLETGRYALRDKKTGASWMGSIRGRPTGEYWVDPYSEEVWKYNVDLAAEMAASGFDEIQFDYIRFPTDGDNMDSIQYSWADPGMDMESALTSFLIYVHENLDAPLSVDIYGSSGWYRSAYRTGQDIGIIARYADAICPMFYPSHFEQEFQAQAPATERPYRIYRTGSFRARHFARGMAVIRPWVQSFYLDVAYDRKYYSPDYVAKQVAGVRDSTNDGFSYWNNIARYDEVPTLAAPAAVQPAPTSAGR